MPTFDITSPAGDKFRVTAPEGATEEEIMRRVQQQQKPAAMSGTVPVETTGKFLKETVKNIPSSAASVVEATARPFFHPIETTKDFYNLGRGVLEELGLTSGSAYKQYPEAIGRFFAQRYGGIDKALDTLKHDPVGVAMDAATILTAGGGLLERGPGMIGDVGEVLRSAGRATDPLAAAGKATAKIAEKGGKGAAKLVGGIGTYTGEKPLLLAFGAGREGGERSKVFLQSMREQMPKAGIVTDARKAVAQMRKQRGEAYRSGMKEVGADQSVLKFDAVDNAVKDMDKVATYKGMPISPSTDLVRDQIKKEINAWKTLDAKEFHTPEGMDALKKKIGDIRDGTEPGTPQRLVADQAYQAVRRTIIEQAPVYAHVMEAYETASDMLKQMEKTLSINPNAAIDTTLRKLQSVLRDNVNTSYGHRGELAEYLVNAGAPHLLEKIAGQVLQQWVPRGLGKLPASASAILGIWDRDVHDLLYAAVLIGLSSPRLMGEAAFGLGKVARHAEQLPPMQPIGQAAFQAGRETEQLPSSP